MEEQKSRLNIQWFPGHMTKAKRQMEEHLKMVDMVIELRDARIPDASKNPLIDELTAHKPRLILLSKKDKAEAEVTAQWVSALEKEEVRVLAVDLLHEKLEKKITAASQELMQAKIERMKRRGMRPRAIRAMVAGVPNVGKSTLINSLAHRRAAVTGDRPGVTKALQWVKVGKSLELLDTPGVLWPKFEDQAVGERLALIGSMNDEILNREEMALSLLVFIGENYPEALEKRYQLTLDTAGADGDAQTSLHSALALLEAVCKSRGCLKKGGEPEYEKGAALVLDDFRSGRLGRMTLELPKKEA